MLCQEAISPTLNLRPIQRADKSVISEMVCLPISYFCYQRPVLVQCSLFIDFLK